MPQASTISVLVVDDQLTMRALIRNALQQIGFKDIREAPDGEEALKNLLAKPARGAVRRQQLLRQAVHRPGTARQDRTGVRTADMTHHNPPEDTERAIKVHVTQGESHVTTDPNVVMTTVLGSCIAACIRDPQSGVGGMNHFLLPDAGDGRGTGGGPGSR